MVYFQCVSCITFLCSILFIVCGWGWKIISLECPSSSELYSLLRSESYSPMGSHNGNCAVIPSVFQAIFHVTGFTSFEKSGFTPSCVTTHEMDSLQLPCLCAQFSSAGFCPGDLCNEITNFFEAVLLLQRSTSIQWERLRSMPMVPNLGNPSVLGL